MKVQRYRSRPHPEYFFMVLPGTDLSDFDGEIAYTLDLLSPLDLEEEDLEFESVLLDPFLPNALEALLTTGICFVMNRDIAAARKVQAQDDIE